ncbi:serine/threonine-protein phosphatase 6 catalytic subunit [Anaeramoeba flamelloides]|uniref:Serine/threonine-protein phosphatase n=1 Tax=Anaeramoeba flamelloides TaxID=1746091 RepID=A0AAV7ZS90_9EUKA|nr:serine/threonine-protein phosphatase 6 catalytic subunit [Anaeramoeba flamelloides]
MNIDNILNKLKKKETLETNDLKLLLEKGSELLKNESNIVQVTAPVAIVGDVHGQFYDLLKLFETNGDVGDKKYIFLGDYVNRGTFSILSFSYLLALKVKFPDQIIMLRGNHECRPICELYGLKTEIERLYSNTDPLDWFIETFYTLPLGAVINNSILCIHGGISELIETINDIETIDRFQEVPKIGKFTDLLWSDPTEEVEMYKESPRGAGRLFGKKALNEFLEKNSLTLIVRSHMFVEEGYKYHFGEEKCLTIFSSPKYCYSCNNVGAVLNIDQDLNRSLKVFEAVPDEERDLSFVKEVKK